MTLYEQVEKTLTEKRLLPLVSFQSPEDIQPIGEVLLKADLPIIEIAFRSDLAAAGIEDLRKNTEMLVGAGTVKNLEQAKAAYNAGAQFIVTPGLSEEVVAYFADREIPVYPGVVTPSEVMKANSLGLYTLKAFPIGSYGGIETLKALHAPFFESCFIPTGGVDQKNYQDYLQLDYIKAVGGTFILPRKLIQEQNWSGLQQHVEGLIKK